MSSKCIGRLIPTISCLQWIPCFFLAHFPFFCRLDWAFRSFQIACFPIFVRNIPINFMSFPIYIHFFHCHHCFSPCFTWADRPGAGRLLSCRRIYRPDNWYRAGGLEEATGGPQWFCWVVPRGAASVGTSHNLGTGIPMMVVVVMMAMMTMAVTTMKSTPGIDGGTHAISRYMYCMGFNPISPSF